MLTLLLSLVLVLLSPSDRDCDQDGHALNGAVHPLDRERISSPFGIRKDPMTGEVRAHTGVDLVALGNPDVHSIEDGLVVFAGLFGEYGNLVSVKHANDYSSHYAHLESFSVEVGDEIGRGIVIGRVGATGRATGAHLHFEIRRNGCLLDPLTVLPRLGAKGVG